MSSLSLTERPKILSEVVGQLSTVDYMKIKGEDLSYPPFMLFHGSAGSGKSTLAFIVAKTLNCRNPVLNSEGYYDPCNECKSCMDVNNQVFGRDVSYMEASKIGKDAVFKIQKLISSMPMYDNKRVIIIDEAHLINSKEARGAMLTVLENNIDTVKFILCTTDISKFDKAFMSRLQSFKFKELAAVDIGRYLGKLFNQQVALWDQEGEDLGDKGIKYGKHIITPDDINNFKEVVSLIAFNSDGVLRQAIQYYQRCVDGFIFTKKEAQDACDFMDTENAEAMMVDIVNGRNFYNVFKYLKETDTELFFNYFYKMIQEAVVLHETNSLVQPYKEDLYHKLIANGRVVSIFNMLLDLEQKKGYGDQARYIRGRIMQFMMSNPDKNKEPERRKVVKR